MLITITTTHVPATDLGYLLHKHPARVQTFDLSFGRAHVFYPEASPERCTAALLLDIDPVQLAQARFMRASHDSTLQPYVNDRPYVASSFLSVAIGEVFGTALSGRCKERPALAATPLPLQARLAALPCSGGEAVLRRLFEPLGYQVTAARHPLDEQVLAWGDSEYVTVTLTGTLRLCDLLSHLYVLVPVLDDEKHYWIGDDEVAKLLRYGEGWLARHSERELIARRYLKHQRDLTDAALAQLAEEGEGNPDATDAQGGEAEDRLEASIGLQHQRLETVLAVLHDRGVARVLDLGCGDGRLLRMLLHDPHFRDIVGMDVSRRQLDRAADRVHVEDLPAPQRQRLTLIQGSLLYHDARLMGYEAAVLIEVIEHLEPTRLGMFAQVLFGCTRPGLVILTTPNREYNSKWPGLPAGTWRHRDHRFEWTRAEFQQWATQVVEQYDYAVDFRAVGPEDPHIGSPTQMGLHPMHLTIPECALVVLIGPSGAGKSTFAQRHFRPTEVLSSDACRALVADSETDQAATPEAFEVLHFIAAKRLAAGRLTVIDATNVQPEARRPLLALAREYHCLAVAIVFDLPADLCQAQNRRRPDRDLGPAVIHRQIQQLKRSLRGLKHEGFRYIYTLSSPEEMATATVERQALWSHRQHDHGPFDIIGDVHGCGDELEQLLAQLGYTWGERPPEIPGRYPRVYRHPEGRKAIFVGDLVDRGPRILDTYELVRSMVDAGSALCVPGNHEAKLVRKLRGRDVVVNHGLAQTLAELEGVPPELGARICREMADFFDGLISHYVLDDGRLVVAHAGMKASLQGRASRQVREFALYGETTGETDAFGLPIRYNWAAEYRGSAVVVYGHTPVPEAEWLNRTINIDTGCVFGGKLTALRYPELELVSVPAARIYTEPIRPFLPSTADPRTAQQQADDLLDVSEVLGKRAIHTRLWPTIVVREEQSAAALEVMSRFAVDPRWLIYLPPTMSPPDASDAPDRLEDPTQVLGYYRRQGIAQVIAEEKHMGSRAIVIVCRDEGAVRRRFGIIDGGIGVCYTRTGRRFFADPAMEDAWLAHVHAALTAAGFWEAFETEWVCLDGEVMPWSFKAQSLLRQQYAPVGAAGRAASSEVLAALRQAADRGLAVEALSARYQQRATVLAHYVEAYRRYCWPVHHVEDLRFAPFHILATEGAAHVDKTHQWHLDTIGQIVTESASPCLQLTTSRLLDLSDIAGEAALLAWWEELTAQGGEGIVVKPLDFIARGRRGLVQPAMKCRGREYLRIIYGPEYTAPEHLARLRQRHLGTKRALALREFVLGIEALERFVRHEPLRRVHQCVFGVLALESEAVDPRL